MRILNFEESVIIESSSETSVSVQGILVKTLIDEKGVLILTRSSNLVHEERSFRCHMFDITGVKKWESSHNEGVSDVRWENDKNAVSLFTHEDNRITYLDRTSGIVVGQDFGAK